MCIRDRTPRMSDISTLKEKINIKTFHFLLLSMLTLGLYSYVWLYRVSTAVEEVTRTKVMTETFLVGFLTLSGLGTLLIVIPVAYTEELSLLWNVTTLLVSLVWCFRVRRAIRAYALAKYNFEPPMNRVYTVLFVFCHINYCINALPDDKKKHELGQEPTDRSMDA